MREEGPCVFARCLELGLDPSAKAPHRQALDMLRLNTRMLGHVLLVGVLPMTATLGLVTVIAIERMQCDPLGIALQKMYPAWLACGCVFAILHILATHISSGRNATLREYAQALLAVAIVVSAAAVATLGMPFSWAEPGPPSAVEGALRLIFIGILLPFTIVALFLLFLAIGSAAFGASMALGTAPDLFDANKRSVAERVFAHHMVVAPMAFTVALVGTTVAETMFSSATSVESAIFPGLMRALFPTPRSPNAVFYAAAVPVLVWTLACSLTCGATLSARNPSVLPYAWMAVAIQLMIAAALIFFVASRVHDKQAIFETRPPAQMVRYIRGGMPSMHEPFVASGRQFRGPFILKRRGKVGVSRATVRIEHQGMPSIGPVIDLEFRKERREVPMTCPETPGPVLTCQFVPALVRSGRRLESLVIQRELAHDYDRSRDAVSIEFSNEMHDAWLWRDESSCWLHLHWPTAGDLARSQIDCNANWTDLVGPFRAILDGQFPRIS
jgi:hypothetical protein